MSVTITNPDDPSQTYTYGKRGRRPAWVLDYEKINGKPETATHSKTVVEDPGEYEITQRGNTLHNKTLDKKYTLGQKGRKPAWVIAYLTEQNGGELPAPTPKEKTPDVAPIKRHPSGLREWVFRCESKLDGQAIIVAKTDVDAMGFYNPCSRYPLTPVAFNHFWHEVEYGETFKEGYWRYNSKTNEWYQPEPVKTPEPATIKR